MTYVFAISIRVDAKLRAQLKATLSAMILVCCVPVVVSFWRIYSCTCMVLPVTGELQSPVRTALQIAETVA